MCDDIVVDARSSNLSKHIARTAVKMNPKVNYGLVVIMRCQCRFIDCDECSMKVENVCGV
jgi:hypothetical protein